MSMCLYKLGDAVAATVQHAAKQMGYPTPFAAALAEQARHSFLQGGSATADKGHVGTPRYTPRRRISQGEALGE